MDVTAFRIFNFMGFEDSGWIELRPITLLFRQQLGQKRNPGKAPACAEAKFGLSFQSRSACHVIIRWR